MTTKSKWELRTEVAKKKFGPTVEFWKLSRKEQQEVNEQVESLFADQFDESIKVKAKEVQEIFKEVNKLARESQEKLSEATSLLDKHGLGMHFYISPLSQAYLAEDSDVAQFFGVEDFEEIEDLVEELGISVSSHDDYGATGWQYSAVCY